MMLVLAWVGCANAQQPERGEAHARAPSDTAGGPSLAAPPPPKSPLRIERDIEYARADGRPLLLDLYLRDAANKMPLPVVIWIHGDTQSGDKSPTPAVRLVANGFAVASIGYRLGEGAVTSQIHDLAAAAHWLRANAARYDLDPAHLGVWSFGSGARLAVMLGTAGSVVASAGRQSTLDQSRRVEAVVDFFGPVDAPYPAPAGSLLEHIAPDSAPFLIVHGTADTVVPPAISESLQIALKKSGVDADLEYVMGGGHEFSAVETPEIAERVTRFFDAHLRNDEHQRDDAASISEPQDSWIDPFMEDISGTRYELYPTPSRGPNTRASYRVYLPPGYALPANAGRRYPVIYFLHGLNDDSRKASTSGYIARIDAAIRANIMPPAIVIAVQALNRNWYVDSPDGKHPMESVIIKDLIGHVDATFRTVATRDGRAIEGHSMGGAGALHLGFKYPDLFGAVSSLSAALIPAEQFTTGMNLEMLNEVFGGDLHRYDAEGGWSLAASNAERIRGRTRIRLICGTRDPLLGRSLWMSGILSALKIPHEMLESQGAPHSIKDVLARLDRNPFAFYAAAFARLDPAEAP